MRVPTDEREWTRDVEAGASPPATESHGEVREPSEDAGPARAESGGSGEEEEAGYGHGV